MRFNEGTKRDSYKIVYKDAMDNDVTRMPTSRGGLQKKSWMRA
jgi:hypothetical protein